MITFPHEGVYTRLGPSPIHGVGVFAIEDIPSGTNVFANDQGAIVWVTRESVGHSGIGSELLRLYYDFGIVRGGLIGVPVNFNSLTPGWYVNEPSEGNEPNVAMSDDFHFFATRNIASGEEITALYVSYSDDVHRRSDTGGLI